MTSTDTVCPALTTTGWAMMSGVRMVPVASDIIALAPISCAGSANTCRPAKAATGSRAKVMSSGPMLCPAVTGRAAITTASDCATVTVT